MPFAQTLWIQSLRLAFARHLPFHKGGLWKVPANNAATGKHCRAGVYSRRAAQCRLRKHRGYLQAVGDIHECPAVAQCHFRKQRGYNPSASHLLGTSLCTREACGKLPQTTRLCTLSFCAKGFEGVAGETFSKVSPTAPPHNAPSYSHI